MNGRQNAPGSRESAAPLALLDAAGNEAEAPGAVLDGPTDDTTAMDGTGPVLVTGAAEQHVSMQDFQDLGLQWRFRPPVRKPVEIADAFSALLAAEQGEATPTDAEPDQGVAMESFIDQVTSRVAERLTAAVVHERTSAIVHELAERLIRDELARVRTAATLRR